MSLTPDSCISQLGYSINDEMNVAADAEQVEMTYTPEKETGKGFHKRGMHGKGINWGKIWKGIKSVVGIGSKVAGAVANVVPHPYAQLASKRLNTANQIVNGQGYHHMHGHHHGHHLLTEHPHEHHEEKKPKRKGRGLLMG